MLSESLNIETELLPLIAEGDEVAFTVLFNHYKNRIYSVAFKLTCSAATSEEIVQDVFLTIWLRRNVLMDIKDFNSYLFVVTRNRVYKVLRQNANDFKTIGFQDEYHLLGHNDTENSIMDKEYSQVLQKAVERLPLQQQKVYKLVKEQGLKREEVATLLNVHPETIKSHLAQAMRCVRAYCVLNSDINIGIIIFLFYQFQNW